MTEKLSSREIEARMQEIADEILAFDRQLRRQGDEATLSFDCRKFALNKLNHSQRCADVTIWLGSGLE